jgi:F0F1-type ATP synthase membrane subunit b/b'
MKFFTLLIVMTFSFSLFAGEQWKVRRDFRVDMMGKRIAMIQTAQSCFKAASERSQFKECRKTLKAEREALKAEAQATRAGFKKNK